MKIPTICENETNCCTDCWYWKYQLISRKNLQNTNFQNDAYCGYWQYQQIATKKLQNSTFQSCLLWVLYLWQQKKIQNKVQIAVQMYQMWGSEMKWCQTNIVMDIFYIKYVNPKNKGGLTPLHMATINIQSLKYVNIVLQKKFKKRWLLYMIISAIFNLVLQFVPKWQMTK